MKKESEITQLSPEQQLTEYRAQQGKNHIKTQVKDFLDEVQALDEALEKFKQDFFHGKIKDDFAGVAKDLSLTFSKMVIKAKQLGAAILPIKDEKNIEKCQQHFKILLDNPTDLSSERYQQTILPLIRDFWNFKYEIENYYAELVKPKKREISGNVPPKKETADDEAEKQFADILEKIAAHEARENKPKIPQHVLLQKFKDSKENKVPSLDQALRRAAAFGTLEDIENLLALGADINAKGGETEQTALHQAVRHNQPLNTFYLVSKQAKRRLKDKAGKKALDYADSSHYVLFKEILADSSHNLFNTQDGLVKLLSFLSVDKLYQVRSVSTLWKESVEHVITTALTAIGIMPAQITKFFSLPGFLQYVISKWLIEKNAHEKVKNLLDMLVLSREERKKKLASIPALKNKLSTPAPHSYYVQTYPLYSTPSAPSQPQDIISDIGITLYYLKIATLAEILTRESILCTQYGLLMLAKGLLTSAQLNIFKHSGSPTGTNDNLGELVCRNGFIALSKELITPEQAARISNLRALLSDIGLQALTEKLITAEQAKQIYHSGSNSGPYDNLQQLLTENGLALLRGKFITPEQVAYVSWGKMETLFHKEGLALLQDGYLSFKNFKVPSREWNEFIEKLPSIYSKFGVQALREKLLTQEQMEKIPSLHGLLTERGIQALREGTITAENAREITDLQSLLSETGIVALREGVITLEQAKQTKKLAILKYPGGVTALKERLITLQDAALFHSYGETFQPKSFAALLTPMGLQALREKLITPQQAAQFYHSGSVSGFHDSLQNLLTPTGLQALRNKLITPEQACRMMLHTLFNQESGPDILLALKYKLISLDDFKYPGKYYFHGINTNDLKKMVAPYKQTANPEKLAKATQTAQRLWRGHLAQKKLGLFKEIKTCMQSGNIHALDELQKVKQLADKNKITEASAKLEAVKSTFGFRK